MASTKHEVSLGFGKWKQREEVNSPWLGSFQEQALLLLRGGGMCIDDHRNWSFSLSIGWEKLQVSVSKSFLSDV